jgi:prevent-host-death family protein
MNIKHRAPQIVLKNGKPSAVILDIDQYRELLDRLEDAEDVEELEKMRRRPLVFTKLEDFLSESNSGA